MTNSDRIREPDNWTSGDDPMTDAQRSYLETLSQQTGEEVPGDMTKAAASEKIDELRAKAGLAGEPMANEADDVAMDDDTDFRHSPVPPTSTR